VHHLLARRRQGVEKMGNFGAMAGDIGARQPRVFLISSRVLCGGAFFRM